MVCKMQTQLVIMNQSNYGFRIFETAITFFYLFFRTIPTDANQTNTKSDVDVENVLEKVSRMLEVGNMFH